MKAKSEQSSALWAFLNSPFGIWLLGSIVLASVTWGFGYFSSLWTERAERVRSVARIYIELGLRFELAEFEVAQWRLSRNQELSAREFLHLIEIALAHANGQRSISFPEYRKLPATALLALLASYEPSERSTYSMINYWSHAEVRLRSFAEQAKMKPSESKYHDIPGFDGITYMNDKLRPILKARGFSPFSLPTDSRPKASAGE